MAGLGLGVSSCLEHLCLRVEHGPGEHAPMAVIAAVRPVVVAAIFVEAAAVGPSGQDSQVERREGEEE